MTRRAAWPEFARIAGLSVIAALLVTACGEANWSSLFAEPFAGAPGSAGLGASSGSASRESESSLAGLTFPAAGGTAGSRGGGSGSPGGRDETEEGSAGDPASNPSGAGGEDASDPTHLSAGGSTTAWGGGGPHPGAGKDGANAGGGGSSGSGGGELPGAGAAACGGAQEFCDGLDNDCDGDVDEDAACPTGCIGQADDGTTGYMYCAGKVRFEAGVELCRKSEMHLVWIESAEENARLVSAVKQLGIESERLWIGGSDREREGEWKWLDASGKGQVGFWSGNAAAEGGHRVENRYTNWGANRPNDSTLPAEEDCLNLALDRPNLEVGSWNDDPCDSEWPIVCEK